ncbi:MAG: Trk family potassium uptake protein [Acidobacteria bacterium]|jgi:trk system potassium uptake protein TrkH|nr:Trk family potassium uptake protein [Acidobacteriota bacterium]
MRPRPALLVVLAFAAMILIGTALLQLQSTTEGRLDTRIITSAFTSVSAVCVTGLTVVDLSSDMGFGGQLAVLVLIQIGGLGVLTLSNWVLLSLRGRLGLYGSILTVHTIGAHPRVSPAVLLRRIMVFTLSSEAVGALILFLRFQADYHAGQAVWLAIFHSVSAFCNAGFSLFSDSLIGYSEDLVVNLTVMALIVVGGIGFVAAMDVVEQAAAVIKRTRRKLAFHTRVVVVASLVLIVTHALFFLAFEWNNTFASESVYGEIVQSLFLSVTARTAGFNTVEIAHLTNMTLMVVVVLMIIGASPGSTGGGVKTTSMVLIMALVRAHFFNRPEAEIGRRRVPPELVAKALALVALYACFVVIGMIALQATEFGELPHQQTRGLFLEHLFEVVSALSTVGLSMGLTTRLSDGGLLVLMGLMFVGRVGPLVIAASLIGERSRLDYRLPEADVIIG